MADTTHNGEVERNKNNNGVNFTGTNDCEMDTSAGDSLPAGKSVSRFQVERVDSEQKPNENGTSELEDHENSNGVPAKSTKQPASVAFMVGDEKSTPGAEENEDSHAGTYETHNTQRTFAHNTMERLPHEDHYRNILSATDYTKQQRPMINALLHGAEAMDGMDEGENGHATNNGEQVKAQEQPAPTVKFGWIVGVLIRCLLNIFGVMLFMRHTWVVGQAGLGQACLIIAVCKTITTITTMSMSAITSNGEVKGGGAYFLISRNLGPEFGTAIGVVFGFANIIATAMYIVGAAEAIQTMLWEKGFEYAITGDEANDQRVIGLVILVILIIYYCLAGMSGEALMQKGLLLILVIAIVNVAVGAFLPDTPERTAMGVRQWNVETFKENWYSDYRNESFFSVFSVFFPATTGILGGASISGDLKSPKDDIPKGTFSAIVLTGFTYTALAFLMAGSVQRDAGGYVLGMEPNATHLVYNGTHVMYNDTTMMYNESTMMYQWTTGAPPVGYMEDLLNGTAEAEKPVWLYDGPNSYCMPGENCRYGLQNDMAAAQFMSANMWVTFAGVLAATLSSALANLVAGPKIIEALMNDGIFSHELFQWGAKRYGTGRYRQPWPTMCFCFLLTAVFIAIGNLNTIALLISNFFLATYGLINYACFDASYNSAPGWRPGFKGYNKWVSLACAVSCLVIMFIMSWIYALITIVILFAIFKAMYFMKVVVEWGHNGNNNRFQEALDNNLRLIANPGNTSAQNYRIQMLVLTGFPSDRPALVDFAATVCSSQGNLICGQIIISDHVRDAKRLERSAYAWLKRRHVKSFYTSTMAPSFRQGAEAMLQCVGLGCMKPNLMIMGYKGDWKTCDPKENDDYFNVIQSAFNRNMGVGILWVKEGLDCSHLAGLLDQAQAGSADDNSSDDELATAAAPVRKNYSFIELTPLKSMAKSSDTLDIDNRRGGAGDQDNISRDYVSGSDDDGLNYSRDDLNESQDDLDKVQTAFLNNSDEPVPKNLLKNVNRFNRRQKSGYIDVYWMFDDGGVTVLVPYLISTRNQWKNAKLRIFIAGRKERDLDKDQTQLVTMMSRFRIDFDSMNVIDLSKSPCAESMAEFERLCEPHMLKEGESITDCPWKISENLLFSQIARTKRNLRMGEVMKEVSAESSFVVMTLPMPRKGISSAYLYSSWLEMITKDATCPVLLLRGNQESVLTYYA